MIVPMKFLDERIIPLIDAFDTSSIPYMVVGLYASNVYGIPRATKDFDVVVDVTNDSLSAIKPLLPPNLKLDPQLEFEGITGTIRNIVRFSNSQFVAEIFRIGNDPHNMVGFQRRVAIIVGDRPIWIHTPEDVIITKLRWNRSKDIDDIKSVLLVQSENELDLDWDYIYHWTNHHKTRKQLDEIIAALPNID